MGKPFGRRVQDPGVSDSLHFRMGLDRPEVHVCWATVFCGLGFTLSYQLPTYFFVGSYYTS